MDLVISPEHRSDIYRRRVAQCPWCSGARPDCGECFGRSAARPWRQSLSGRLAKLITRGGVMGKAGALAGFGAAIHAAIHFVCALLGVPCPL